MGGFSYTFYAIGSMFGISILIALLVIPSEIERDDDYEVLEKIPSKMDRSNRRYEIEDVPETQSLLEHSGDLQNQLLQAN
jgi:hypothetical protein